MPRALLPFLVLLGLMAVVSAWAEVPDASVTEIESKAAEVAPVPAATSPVSSAEVVTPPAAVPPAEIITAPVVEQAPGPTPVVIKPKKRVRMVSGHSIPIIWDGRQLGTLMLSVGEVLQVISDQGQELELQKGKQKFRVPKSYTSYDLAEDEPPEPLTSGETPAAKAQREQASLSVARKGSPEEDRVIVYAYLEQTKKFLAQTPQNVRTYQYVYLKKNAPGKATQALARLRSDPGVAEADRQMYEALHKAFTFYTLGMWSKFEEYVGKSIEMAQ
jgi:hypothetical protein